MISFTATIKKFNQQGEKTGWTYIEIPEAIAQQLKPGTKKSFRVKGALDQYEINAVALIPMGGGNFIMALNAAMRKELKKQKGATLKVQLEVDEKKLEQSAALLACLHDEPKALAAFKKLPPSHQHYYTRWIESAKTEPTKAKRIATAVTALATGLPFGEAVRALKEQRAGLPGGATF